MMGQKCRRFGRSTIHVLAIFPGVTEILGCVLKLRLGLIQFSGSGTSHLLLGDG